MSKPNRPPNETDPICEAPNCPKPYRHFVPLHKSRPQRFHDNECKGLAMTQPLNKLICQFSECGLPYERTNHQIADRLGAYHSITCANKARARDEKVRFEGYCHGVGIEPAHMPGIGPCELWTAGLSNGYGVFTLADGTQIQATRYAWKLANGDIPASLQVLHSCDTPACIRLSHLRIDTHDANHREKAEKGRGPKRAGEPRDKLSWDIVEDARLRYSRGEITQVALSMELGVTQAAVSHFIRWITWKTPP
jgi:hypothetical protein